MMLNNILLAAIEVQPIEPSRIIDAAQGAGQGAVVAGQSLAGSLAFIALFIGGEVVSFLIIDSRIISKKKFSRTTGDRTPKLGLILAK